MWALQFFVYAMIVWVLAIMFAGTMINYYLSKKNEYEIKKMIMIGKAIETAKSSEKTE